MIDGLIDILRKYYDKLIAFLIGFASEALMDISTYIKALLP